MTLESPDRGLMFLRIRDEVRMTMAAYETLCERGIAYGSKNAVLFKNEEEGTQEQVCTAYCRIFCDLRIWKLEINLVWSLNLRGLSDFRYTT